MPGQSKTNKLVPPTFIVPAVVLVALAVLFVYYYFPAKSRREEALNQLAFRQLGALSELVRNRIATYGTVHKQWWSSVSEPATTKQIADFSQQVPGLQYRK